jgi:branched-chain amino acid transport system ATP-binding protein
LVAQAALEIEGLTAGYAGMTVVWDVSLVVGAQETVLLLGANGAGKSTVLKAVAGLLPARGAIRLFGEPIERLSTAKRARRGLAFMSEQGIFPTLSVRENLLLGAALAKGGRFEERLEEMLTLFPDLKGRLSEEAGSLSGGQRKMVGVAKCLISDPRVLVMDEPSAGLSPKFVSEVVDILGTLRERGLSVLVAEQNVEFLKVASSVVVLEGGYVRYQGSTQALEDDAALHEAFFGLEGLQGV